MNRRLEREEEKSASIHRGQERNEVKDKKGV